jgi:hypothetical protein
MLRRGVALALNPNFVLAAVVTVLLFGIGAVLAIVLAGGGIDVQLARAGIITTMLAPTIVALVAILQGAKLSEDVRGVHEQVNGHLDKHMELSANQSSATAHAAARTAEAATRALESVTANAVASEAIAAAEDERHSS